MCVRESGAGERSAWAGATRQEDLSQPARTSIVLRTISPRGISPTGVDAPDDRFVVSTSSGDDDDAPLARQLVHVNRRRPRLRIVARLLERAVEGRPAASLARAVRVDMFVKREGGRCREQGRRVGLLARSTGLLCQPSRNGHLPARTTQQNPLLRSAHGPFLIMTMLLLLLQLTSFTLFAVHRLPPPADPRLQAAVVGPAVWRLGRALRRQPHALERSHLWAWCV